MKFSLSLEGNIGTALRNAFNNDNTEIGPFYMDEEEVQNLISTVRTMDEQKWQQFWNLESNSLVCNAKLVVKYYLEGNIKAVDTVNRILVPKWKSLEKFVSHSGFSTKDDHDPKMDPIFVEIGKACQAIKKTPEWKMIEDFQDPDNDTFRTKKYQKLISLGFDKETTLKFLDIYKKVVSNSFHDKAFYAAEAEDHDDGWLFVVNHVFEWDDAMEIPELKEGSDIFLALGSAIGNIEYECGMIARKLMKVNGMPI